MIYIISFILLVGFQLAYFRVAEHFRIIDKPNVRSSHKTITLRGGGIVFYFGALLFFIISKFEYPWFFTGLTLISIISFADDVKEQSFKLRLLMHFAGLLLMFYQSMFFSMPWYFIVLILIVCTGILNAYNFMDGINGITGVYSLAVTGALWYVNNFVIHYVNNQFIYLIVISLMVFNFFNFRTKAKCFAGDVGSISIAFIILFLLSLLINETLNLSYLVLLAVYGVDTVLTLIHRIILKENIFAPHRKHLFQLLANEKKIPQLVVSSGYALLQLVIFGGLLIFKNYSYIYLVSVVVLLSIVYIYVKRKIFHLHKKQ